VAALGAALVAALGAALAALPGGPALGPGGDLPCRQDRAVPHPGAVLTPA